LHSLLRHLNQWFVQIPALREVMARIDPAIGESINRIQNSRNKAESALAINELNNLLKNLSQNDFFGKNIISII
jgi:hypothetical protein